jgi:SAM-dependent methyltransferase
MKGDPTLGRPFGYEYAESLRWRRLERIYIRTFGHIDLPTRIRARLIIKTLRNISWKTLLDFGVGTGVYSFYFSRFPGVRVWGIDTDPQIISCCESIATKIQRKSLSFIRGSSIFETNRLKPDSIDVVLAVEVLQYLPDIQAGLQEIHKVLKEGGYLIAHVPMLGHKRDYEKTLFNPENLPHILQASGLEPLSITRTFGKILEFLSQAFSYCSRFRLLAAITYPLFLLASLPFGGENSNGCYSLIVARKCSQG